MSHALIHRPAPTAVLQRWLLAPDLVQQVRNLPTPAFSELVRHVGLEDAGELVALATPEQLVAAFDEDLFVNDRPGERERFDPARFATWLEVLLEAGDQAAAERFSALSEDFVIQAISSLVLVLDHDGLTERIGERGDEDRSAWRLDKALGSSLSEEIDGYLLIARRPDGWDSTLALILALDRERRDFLERILDRSARLHDHYLDDLDALSELLSEEESLAEDVEAERDARRGRQGYVEPRAARSFLTLAKQGLGPEGRDPLTKEYFRGLDPNPSESSVPPPSGQGWAGLLPAASLAESEPTPRTHSALVPDAVGPSYAAATAMQALAAVDADLFGARTEELAYLVNVLLAGAAGPNGRLRASEAAEAALATVSLGLQLWARREDLPASDAAHLAGLQQRSADRLFRLASQALAGLGPPWARGFLLNQAELTQAQQRLLSGDPPKG